MKFITLDRKPTTETETEGFLTLPGSGLLATIERPWIEAPDNAPGGLPFKSCVPVGKYQLIPHTRPDGSEVVALIGEAQGVYYLDEDRPNAIGRYLCLFHVANWAHDVVGCIGPGLYHKDSNQGRMVSSSGKSMRRLMNYIDGDDATLEIRWI